MKKYKLLIISILLLFVFVGCAKQDENVKMPVQVRTLSTFSFQEFQQKILFDLRVFPVLADTSYSVIDDTNLSELYNEYKNELFEKGVIRWDKSYDCNRFSQSFVTFLQIKFFANTRVNFNQGQALAVGEVYYTKTGVGRHAINILVTQQGTVFFEPQTGKILKLTQKEIQSITFIKF